MARTLNDDAVARAAEALAEAQRTRTLIDRLPPEIRPMNADDGKAVAEAAIARLGWPVVGWKIGYAAEGERRDMDHVPVPGRLLDGALLDSPASVPMTGINHPLIEAEIALVLGADLPPRETPYTVDEARAAVASAHVAIEVADPRYVDFNEPDNPEFMADNACARFVVVGPEIPGWRDAPLADIEVEMRLDGELVSEGRTGDDRCDGFWSLAWLINDVGPRGYGLKAGEVFSSGAVAKVGPLDDAREVVVRFNGAEARLTFSD
jgi:2-keto-4-pentenoate hydratase